MGKSYKVTVIGAGDRGNAYLSILKQYHANDAVLSGLCDVQQDRTDKVSANYGITAKFSDYEKAIADTKPDIVVVATPAYFHCDIASFAMDRGCHVLTEKPFDLSLDKCFKLREKAKATGKSLAIGLQYRNQKSTRALKHMMDQRLIGKNVNLTIFDIRENRPKIAMHDAEFGNGGSLNDVGCHYFDLMRWYCKSNPVSVYASWRINATDRPNLKSVKTLAPDSATIIAEYESGDRLVLEINWGLPTCRENSLHWSSMIGSEGLVRPREFQDREKPGEVKIMSSGKEITVKSEPEDEQDCVNAELGVYDHLIREIEGTGKVQASFEEGILSLACSMAVVKSGVIGRPVMVKEILDTRPTILDCMKK